MRISSVEIANFRALESVEIPLNQFSVLIGENDVGKTSFLYALEKFFEGKKLNDKEDWFKKDITRDIRIVLEFADLPTLEELDGIRRKDNTAVISKVFGHDKKPVVTAILDDSSAVPIPASVPKQLFSIESFHFIPVRRDLSVQFSMNKTALLGKTLRLKMQLVLDDGGGTESLEALQKIMSQAIDEPRRILENYLKEQLHNEAIKLEFANLDINPIEGVSFETVISDDRVSEILIRNRGAGTQNNLIIALFRLIADIGIAEHFIFAMEEPENSLHPKAQRQLLTVIQKMSAGSQVIVTTHSPVFIDRSRFENNILLTRTTGGNTVAKTFDMSMLNDVRIDLGIQASDALLRGGGNCAVLVEGNTEEEGFPVFFEMAGMSEFELGIAIINMRGSDTTRVSGIARLLLAYDIPCVIVLDRNAEQTEIDINREAEKSLKNIKRVFRLKKGNIEDYYPLEIVAEVINTQLSPSSPVTVEEFDEDKFGADRISDFRKIMHEHNAGKSEGFLKQQIGIVGTRLLKERDYPLDDEIKEILNTVKEIATNP